MATAPRETADVRELFGSRPPGMTPLSPSSVTRGAARCKGREPGREYALMLDFVNYW